jgi:hypothetical protein
LPDDDPQPVQQTVVRQTVETTGDGTPIPIGIAANGSPAAVQVVAYPWYYLMAVRAIRSGLQSFSASIGVGATGLPEYIFSLPPQDFLSKMKIACLVGVGAGMASAIQDMIEFTKSFDVTHPQFRG